MIETNQICFAIFVLFVYFVVYDLIVWEEKILHA